MRNPERIDKICDKLKEVWKNKYPDLRFGQLMYNLFYNIGDPFYIEDREMLSLIDKYLDD